MHTTTVATNAKNSVHITFLGSMLRLFMGKILTFVNALQIYDNFCQKIQTYDFLFSPLYCIQAQFSHVVLLQQGKRVHITMRLHTPVQRHVHIIKLLIALRVQEIKVIVMK